MSKTLDTRTILIVAASLSTLSVAKQKIIVQLLITAVSLMLILIGSEKGYVFARIKKRMKHLIPAVISLTFIQILFRREGNVLLQYSVLKITDLGVSYSIIIGLRLLNLILIAGLLFDIPSSNFMLAFKSWHFPYEISFLVTTVIRFIPDYFALFNAYQESLYLRNIDLKRLSLKNKMNVLISLLLPVLINNLNDVKFRAIALDLKGFRLYPQRTSLHEKKLTLPDYFIQITTLLTLGLAIFFI
jgi:energy-coupling factor transport system permease protein